MSVRDRIRAFPADPRFLSEIRGFVASEIERQTFSGFVNELQLAVTEACTNAILHSRSKEVRIRIVFDGPCLEITIEDDGVYERRAPLPEIDGQGHRGMHLMTAMVDRFSVRPGTEERPGTVVTLVKCKA